MGIDVDPYQIRIPDFLTKKDGALTQEAQQWFEYLNRHLEAAWQRSGGPIDQTDVNNEQIIINTADIAVHETRLDDHDVLIQQNADDIDALEAENEDQSQLIAELKASIGLHKAALSDVRGKSKNQGQLIAGLDLIISNLSTQNNKLKSVIDNQDQSHAGLFAEIGKIKAALKDHDRHLENIDQVTA